MWSTELSEKEKRELEEMSVEEREWVERLLRHDGAGPQMMDGIDVSLMSSKEVNLEMKCIVDHERIVRKRAEELKFNPDTLTEKQRIATLRCLSYEELTPFRKLSALYEKNERLQENLSLMEKIDVRIYVAMTLHFSEFGPIFKMDPDNVNLGIFTEQYFKIMRTHGEKVYEKPYYFLTPKHKKRVLEAYAKFISEKGETERESHITELKDNRENTHLPKEEAGL